MHRTETNCETGETIEIAQVAYLDANGALKILDADETPPGGYSLASNAQVLEALSPVPPTPQQQLADLDAANTLTQRNLREFILLTVQAVKQLNPALDLSQIPGVAKVIEVETQAAALRAQL